MAIEYRVRFEDGGATITETGGPITSSAAAQSIIPGLLVKSNRLGPSIISGSAGGGGNPAVGSGGNPAVGSGGNPAVGSGGNPAVGSGGNPAVGSGGNPAVGSGGNPAVGSGGPGLGGVIAVVLGPTSGSGRSGPSMPFQVETQQESNWCWAAISSAVDRYYSPYSFLTQCEVAAEMPGLQQDACIDPEQNNDPEALQTALDVIGRGYTPKTLGIDFKTLQAEIDAGRPVCVRIEWTGGGAHFVVLCGYQEWTSGVNTLETVDVADPFYPDSTRSFNDFPESYHGGGIWSHTYLTK
jgi:hypothetical protein